MQWQTDPWQGHSLSGRAHGSSALPATASGTDCSGPPAPVGIAASSARGTLMLLSGCASHSMSHRLSMSLINTPHVTCWSYDVSGLLCQSNAQ